MNSSLKFSLTTLLLLSAPNCDNSPRPPTSQKLENYVSAPITQKGVVTCFINDESSLSYLNFNNQKVMYSQGLNQSEPLIVHGYVCSEEKVSPSGTHYYEVSIIKDRKAKSEIENQLRKQIVNGKLFSGEISFWTDEEK